MSADPYRQESDQSCVLNRSRLWRPWMARLATAAFCLASPASVVALWVWGESNWPGAVRPPGWAIFIISSTTIHGLMALIIGFLAFVEGALTPGFAVRIAWFIPVYAAIFAARLVRWIAYGETRGR
jgi:hypothetical protein